MILKLFNNYQIMRKNTFGFWGSVLMMLFCFSFASCGSDDELSVETSMYVSLKTSYGTRLTGDVYVFPYASDYDPETFNNDGGFLGGVKATIKRGNGTIVDSYAYVPCTSGELGVWHHYDHEPSESWMRGCNPGTYYLIATRPGWGTMAWMSKIVTIKENNGNLVEFVFTITDGYQSE